ncbi:TPA: hypothetical protein QCU10_005815 [Bacillus anthracis]|nr:hypothetical protein [Bacillus cereus biovar anthracis]HDR6230935.1 hypothetical protein [Bacillus cereus biovar anthracis]HDR6240462.1 hypothetical protein [Bacillus cereus biovar anthracis]HDR6252406.1 hypothetical protein [Bacillus cereus biovar anthracis]HDR6254191.1 hypothetical protein [Bacillus cereus biovar anthracis]
MKTVVRSYSHKGKTNYRNEKGLPFAVTGETPSALIRKTDDLLGRGYDFKTQIYKVIETRRNENVGRSQRSLKPSNTKNGDVGVRMRFLKELIYYECMMVKVN